MKEEIKLPLRIWFTGNVARVVDDNNRTICSQYYSSDYKYKDGEGLEFMQAKSDLIWLVNAANKPAQKEGRDE